MDRPKERKQAPARSPPAAPATRLERPAGFDSLACPPAPITILLVDDHDIVRDGLTALLNRAGNMEVIGSVSTGEEAVIAAQSLHPDVVVMDLVLPALNGLDATLRILEEEPLTHIIVLSACHTSEHLDRALRAGARGYVTKTSASAELVFAIRTVVAGKQYVTPRIISLPAEPGAAGYKQSCTSLSGREREVLRQLVAGASSVDIAEILSLSPKSIDTYRHRIMVKLGVGNRADLIRVALKYELVTV
jgi:DNA-binding NarL/FixJ family response regulator